MPSTLVKMPVVIAPLAARSDAAADEFAHGTCRRLDILPLTAIQKLWTDINPLLNKWVKSGLHREAPHRPSTSHIWVVCGPSDLIRITDWQIY